MVLVLGFGFRVIGFRVSGSGFHQLLHRLAWVPVPGLEFGLNPSHGVKTIKTIRPQKKMWREEGTEFWSACPDHPNGFAFT